MWWLLHIKIIKEGKSLLMDEISDYFKCEYDQCWWLARDYEKTESKDVEVKFVHPSGPALSFVFPRNPGILKVNKKQILTWVNLNTATGRTYVISKNKIIAETKSLSSRFQFT